MTTHHPNRRRRSAKQRRVQVLTEPRAEFRPERLARIITAAGLDQARRETEAQAADLGRTAKEGSDA